MRFLAEICTTLTVPALSWLRINIKRAPVSVCGFREAATCSDFFLTDGLHGRLSFQDADY